MRIPKYNKELHVSYKYFYNIFIYIIKFIIRFVNELVIEIWLLKNLYPFLVLSTFNIVEQINDIYKKKVIRHNQHLKRLKLLVLQVDTYSLNITHKLIKKSCFTKQHKQNGDQENLKDCCLLHFLFQVL